MNPIVSENRRNISIARSALRKLCFIFILFCQLTYYSSAQQSKPVNNNMPVLRITLLHFPDSAYIDELVIRYDTTDGLKPVSVKTSHTSKSQIIATTQNGKLLNLATYRKAILNDTIPLIVKGDRKDIFFIRLQGHNSIKRHVYIKDTGTTQALHELSANTHFVCHYNPADILHAEKKYVLILSDTLLIKRFYKSSGKLEPGALYSVHYDRKNDQIHVKMGIGKFLVTISDEMGSRVFDGSVVSKNGLVKIGTSDIKNGLYQIKMVDIFGNYESGKFIKY